MTKTLHGKVHGKTIELDEDPGVAEGQDVEVQVTIVQPVRKWGEGILRSAGGWVDYPEMNAIMEEVHQARKFGGGPAARPDSPGREHIPLRSPDEEKTMTITIHAIYENGVFRPTEAVEIPEKSEVEVEIRLIKEGPKVPTLDDIYAILGERFNSGEHDVAARHNEHQP